MSSIGIGYTTFNRPESIQLCLNQIAKHTKGEFELYVYDDAIERKGIAFGKNQCLKALQDCDYIFLFDDDTFPINDNWVQYFIMAHNFSGQHHFLYMKPNSQTRKISQQGFGSEGVANIYLEEFNNCNGCFMFLTKEVIQKVGGFNPNYGIYGFEHASYSERIHKAGLTSFGKYLTVKGTSDFIYAMDLDFGLPFNKQVKHESSLINEITKVEGYVNQNRKVFEEDIKTIYQPLN